ncbi:MAG TPA: hypothetical protein VIF34_10165 [Methylocystis sp.]|jgi:crossover junction endodeoxyribonuclease RuvC
MPRVIGVDIGAKGALALLSPTGELLEVVDMPILRDGPANRPKVNASLLSAIVYRWHADQVFVEFVAARPKEGPTGAFSFGRPRGVIAKDAARSEAIRRWPDKAQFFARVKDDGRAEAALIAVAGLTRTGTRNG